MIFMHELGHYLTAKWSGMKVTEFFIGFGPRLWSFHRGETEYGLKLIPAGAYVRIIGNEQPRGRPRPRTRSGRTARSRIPRRLSVAVAGSTMHFLMAIALMFGLLVFERRAGTRSRATAGRSAPSPPGSPADEGGACRPGDRDRHRRRSPALRPGFPDLSEHLRARPGELVELTVARDGSLVEAEATLAAAHPTTGEEEVGFLGIGPLYDLVPLNPVEAAAEAVQRTGTTIGQSVTALGSFFSPSGISGYLDTLTTSASGDPDPTVEATPDPEADANRLLSPVGAVRVASQAADVGFASVVFLLFIINVFIGVFNLVPLLPLDGGHVVIATYERLRSRGGPALLRRRVQARAPHRRGHRHPPARRGQRLVPRHRLARRQPVPVSPPAPVVVFS